MTATATPAHSHRAALGDFLKTRRAGLSPADVGLPPGTRRRTAGLRREEVALLAGVGVTWYTWLEQGRSINVSSQVLDAVARTLRLNTVEREHLYQLADAAPKHSAPAETVPEAVLEMLNSMSVPASLMNGRWDVLARNDAYQDLFRAWHPLPCVHHNALWCCFAEDGVRGDKFVNYNEEVRHIVARFRSEYARHVGDPVWEKDIRRLAERSPEFAELWARHEVAAPAERVRRFRLPQVGVLNLVNTELAVPAEGDLRMSVYTPGDAETRQRLALLRSRSQTMARVG